MSLERDDSCHHGMYRMNVGLGDVEMSMLGVEVAKRAKNNYATGAKTTKRNLAKTRKAERLVL